VKLITLHVRFYKAFNFDYLRKFHRGTEQLPWEELADGPWYPFVNVPIEEAITTVVGANEAGKSQVLDAIEMALGTKTPKRTDFCRYSRFFLVDDIKRLPDFGGTFSDLTDAESTELRKATGRTADEAPIKAFTLIRGGNGRNTVYLRDGNDWSTYVLKAAELKIINAVVPKPFRLKPNIPLPNAVPLTFLSQDGQGKKSIGSIASRKKRMTMLAALSKLPPKATESESSLSENLSKVLAVFAPPPVAEVDDKDALDKYQLADDLLIKIAGIDREHFSDLIDTIGDGRDGYVDGVEELINRRLATRLNFRRWWTQDSSFQLGVTVRESDVAFIVRDRTGTHYSFSERSGGLGYYLSYFVQYQRHEPLQGRSEILLMDEPDAYLSSQGQKDLLRIFDAFADPDDGSDGCQVVYVTHSPFLVDKNHAERIRVIEKGEGDEGTRVVRDVSRNHYEPLRSAFGAMVGETTFMGSCNLMVEGIGDQILLAGLSRRLQRKDLPHTDYLDLNDLTIVPAGGASQIPYLVYLARGRDVEKPAVIVLLDSDKSGNDARRTIRRGGAYKKELVAKELVVQIGDDRLAITSDRPGGAIDIEDLVPIEVAVRAAETYAAEFLGADPAELQLDPAEARLDDGVLAAAQALLNAALPDGEKVDKIEKVGFARGVLTQLSLHDEGKATFSSAAVDQLESNFQVLCKTLGEMQRTAMREHSDVRLSDRIARIRDGFLEDYQTPPQRVDVQVLFEEMTHALDNSSEAEDVRSELRRLTDVHHLEIDATSEVADFEAFRRDLQGLQYRSRYRSQEPAADALEGAVNS